MISRSIADLNRKANEYTFNPSISFLNWVYACQTLLREAAVYALENTIQSKTRVYVLEMRFLDLVVNKLQSHPDYPKFGSAYSKLFSHVPSILQQCEELKVEIKAHFDNLELANPTKPENELSGKQGVEGYSDLVKRLVKDLDKHETEGGTKRAATPLPCPDTLLGTRAEHNGSIIRRWNSTEKPKSGLDTSAYALSQSEAGGGDRAKESVLAVPTDVENSLRPIYVPKELQTKFLSLSESNTSLKVETCGILCGKLVKNSFFITHLLIPHQECAPDSCSTTNEEEIFEFVTQNDLFILGWIHTHPTQSCFMSSVDLHTHASYQIMLPEAIAIVCSPHHTPNYGVFRLTEDPGLDVLKKCTEPGFHPHEERDLYVSATPGHYHEIDFDLRVKDLR